MDRPIAAICVKDGKMLIGKNGLLTATVKKDERPIDVLKSSFKANKAEYIATVADLEIYLTDNMEAHGEWVSPSDERLDSLRGSIIPHLMWIGLL